MSQHQPHVLVVDAHPKHANIMRTALSTLTDRVDVADSHAAAIAALSDGHFELVLIDDSLAMPNGFDVLHWIQSFDPPPALIVLSEDRGVERRAAALGGGAVDYVVKRPNYEHSLLQAVSRMLACERAAGPSKLTAAAGATALVGVSAAMLMLRQRIEDFARTSATVLVQGETGTGKELVVQALHDASRRAHRPLVALNCAAIPETLIESELFGSRRGAYSGADRDRKGLLAVAEGGTLFLDEVGELPMHLQAKLLRVLETGMYRALGGVAEVRADIRIVAATNRSLLDLVSERAFRADLYYRLNVLRIDVPPLRERRSDIPCLVEHFVARYADEKRRPIVSTEALATLLTHSWPGNVRELEHVIQRTLVQQPGNVVTQFDLEHDLAPETDGVSRRSVSPEHLAMFLARYHGRLGPVAQALSVSVRTVQRWIKDCGLARRDFRV